MTPYPLVNNLSASAFSSKVLSPFTGEYETIVFERVDNGACRTVYRGSFSRHRSIYLQIQDYRCTVSPSQGDTFGTFLWTDHSSLEKFFDKL